MRSARLFAPLGLVLALAAPAPAADAVADGHYKLSYVLGTSEATNFLIKVESRDGKLTGSVAAASNPRFNGTTVESIKADGKVLRVALKSPAGQQSFEGVLPAKGKVIPGSFGNDRFLYPAKLTATEATELTPADASVRLNVPPLQQAQQLIMRPAQLRAQAARNNDAAEKAKLLKQAADALKESETELPKLYREVVEKHADTPAVFEAVTGLLRTAARDKTDVEKARALAAIAAKAAAEYGPRWQTEIHLRAAETLVNQEGFAAVAAESARAAEKNLSDKDPAARQVRVLKTLATALKKAGKADEGKDLDARLARLEEVLDKEYLATVPPFKPEMFEGRKGKSERAVVMELFTGAECPPCVAADVAFDALEKTYKTKDLILIQYHMHIPGPDPLTNSDSEARWDYYQEKFPQGIRGTPSTVFNGKPDAGGGGAMANAKAKYDQYRGLIDPLLEAEAGARVKASATRKGDAIDIDVEVSELAKTGDNVKLRLLLVEESVRYVGGNGLRFHHQVVRAIPGGVAGVSLKDKTSRHTAEVDLGQVRKELTKYLDDYAATKRPFPHADRPMEFKKLAVIALVQDDTTREVLQGVQVEVKGGTEK